MQYAKKKHIAYLLCNMKKKRKKHIPQRRKKHFLSFCLHVREFQHHSPRFLGDRSSDSSTVLAIPHYLVYITHVLVWKVTRKGKKG